MHEGACIHARYSNIVRITVILCALQHYYADPFIRESVRRCPHIEDIHFYCTLNIACNIILPYPCGSIFSHIDLLLLTRATAHARGLIGQWNRVAHMRVI